MNQKSRLLRKRIASETFYLHYRIYGYNTVMIKLAAESNQNNSRDERGRFLPGNREASKRRGKRYRETSVLARRFTVESVQALIDIVVDTQAKSTSRALAARTLLNYGWGKTPINISGLAEAAAHVRSRTAVEKIKNEGQQHKFIGLINRLLLLNPDLSKLLDLLESAPPIRQLEEIMTDGSI